ncbi:hypothetical protein PV350_14340 [Streptomyces sp. PA03-6a]|nr:hypothetical protein [Streptomyces sp. PA03-6a]
MAKLSVNASPEPVAKGGKLTVTGRLTRATTDAATTFVGYPHRDRQGGRLWRWAFAGTTTVAPVAAGGDRVALK